MKVNDEEQADGNVKEKGDKEMNCFGEGAAVEAKRYIENPDFSLEGIGRIDGHVWALILSARPDYVKYCPFERFDAADWVLLLSNRPELAKKISFHGLDWCEVRELPYGQRHITQSDEFEPYGRLEYILDKDRTFKRAVITGICEIPCHIDSLKIPSIVDDHFVFSIRSLKILSKQCRDCYRGSIHECQNGVYSLHRLEIEEGIEEIADYALGGLSVETLILPESAVAIGEHAFEDELGGMLCRKILKGGKKLERK